MKFRAKLFALLVSASLAWAPTVAHAAAASSTHPDGSHGLAALHACDGANRYYWGDINSDAHFEVTLPAWINGGEFWDDCQLRVGDRDPYVPGSALDHRSVTVLQWQLKKCNGFSTLAVDGSFGNSTKNALIALQKRTKIDQDGTYGPQTRKMMKLWVQENTIDGHVLYFCGHYHH